MDPKSREEKNRLFLLYVGHAKAIRKANEEVAATQFVESGDNLDLNVANSVVQNICVEVCLIIKLCKSGRLTASYLEDRMKEIIDHILHLTVNIEEAKSHAGETLACIFCDSLDEIRSCTLELLEQCISIAPFNGPLTDSVRIQLCDSAIEVLGALELFLQGPLRNSMAIKKALEDIANDIKGAVCEMEHFPGGKKMVTQAAIRVGKDAVRLIKAIACSEYLRDDNVPGLVEDMEELVKSSSIMRDQIHKIKKQLFPLREVHEIVAALGEMKISCVDYLESKLRDWRPMMGDYFLRSFYLEGSIQDLKFQLRSVLSTRGGLG